MTFKTRPRRLPAHMRRRAETPAHETRPAEPVWRVGHYDGPTDPARQIQMARFMATGIVPPIYAGNPGACLSVLMKSQALDIPRDTAIQNVWWNLAIGKGSITAQLMAGLLKRHGYQFTVTEESDQRVAMVFHQATDTRRRRLGTVEWTILEAIGAGLTWRSQWQHHPKDMLWARCLMRGARRYASEVGTGLAYTAEELADMSAPAEGSEVHTAVLDILEQATAPGVTSDHIRGELVKTAKTRKLLDLDTGDGQTLGHLLGMLWGEARARETEARLAETPTEPTTPPVLAGAGELPCRCPAAEVLAAGMHIEGVHRDAGNL